MERSFGTIGPRRRETVGWLAVSLPEYVRLLALPEPLDLIRVAEQLLIAEGKHRGKVPGWCG